MNDPHEPQHQPLVPPYAGGPYPAHEESPEARDAREAREAAQHQTQPLGGFFGGPVPPPDQRPADTQRLDFAPFPPPGPPRGPQGHLNPSSRPPVGRVSGWVWPTVAALALVIGLVGGAIGGVIAQNVADDRDGGQVAGGLDSVDTVSAPPLEADNGSVAAVAQKLLPSSVQILADLDGKPMAATGSGFVLDRQGHIVTNNHVVAGAADGGNIQVIDSQGNKHKATLVGRSPVYDLALLSVPDAKNLAPAALGRSEVLHVGDPVVAIGSPLGLSQTVTSGIVSALDRPVSTGDGEDDTSYINAVQTDAAINPGNSGGPLVNLQGQVVGVNSAIATTGGIVGEAGSIGVGFAIPIEQVRVTVDQILKTGKSQYPVIGATVQTGQSAGDGATVEEVSADTPAQQAGLKKGDVVTEINGEQVVDGISLIVKIRTHQPGDTIELTVQRGGKEQKIEVTLAGKEG